MGIMQLFQFLSQLKFVRTYVLEECKTQLQ